MMQKNGSSTTPSLNPASVDVNEAQTKTDANRAWEELQIRSDRGRRLYAACKEDPALDVADAIRKSRELYQSSDRISMTTVSVPMDFKTMDAKPVGEVWHDLSREFFFKGLSIAALSSFVNITLSLSVAACAAGSAFGCELVYLILNRNQRPAN